MQEAYIVAGLRTAVGKAKKGGFRFTRADDLAVEVIKGMLAKVPKLDPNTIDDVIVGTAVQEAEQGLLIARTIALESCGMDVAGQMVNRYCASSVETVAQAVAKIRSGLADVIVAGGAESMSQVPTVGWKTVPNYGIATSNPDYFLGMGATAENVANKYGISREDQDHFSVESHNKSLAAQAKGLFQDEIHPIDVEEVYLEDNKRKTRSWTVSKDEGPRPGTSMEGLSKLRPVFAQGGSVTAGNSSQTSDGAAFMLVMSEAKVKELGVEPIARMVSCVSAGVDPAYMGIGPVAAIPKALKRAGMTLNDISLIELNEAFAAQSLACIKALDLDPSIINPNGGAISMGHPLAATGSRLILTALNELRRRDQKYAVISACVGGGQGIASIVELLK
jgi:acetyl-CoA acyltransferase